MQYVYKKIKILLLLCSLFSYEQSPSLAKEVEEPEKQGMKRLFEINPTQELSFSFIDTFGAEILKDVLLPFFDDKRDQKTILDLSASCKEMLKFLGLKYQAAVEAEHHYQWQNMPLPPRALYMLNVRMLTILGLYINIASKWAEKRDRTRFEKLCTQFKHTQLFTPESFPRRYVELLHLSLACKRPTALQRPLVELLQIDLAEQEKHFAREFEWITNSLSAIGQNEAALYFHFIQFVLGTDQKVIATAQETPLCTLLNNPFMAVLNNDLLTLKKTPKLGRKKKHAETWHQIMALEPTPTIWQLDKAAESNFDFAGSCDKQFIDTSYARVIEYMEKRATILKDAGYILDLVDYQNMSKALFLAGKNAQDDNDKSLYYLKSIKHHKEFSKLHNNLEEIFYIFALDYLSNYAEAYFLAGINAQDPKDKVNFFASSAKRREKYVEKLRDVPEGFHRPASDYYDIAKSYFHAGQYAQGADDKARYFFEAEKNLKLALTGYLSEKNLQSTQEMLEKITVHLAPHENVIPYITDTDQLYKAG